MSDTSGEVRGIWTPDPVRYDAEKSYRDAIAELLEQHFPGRCASPSTLKSIETEDGVRAIGAECGLDPDGNWYHEVAAPYRRRMEFDVAPLIDGTELP